MGAPERTGFRLLSRSAEATEGVGEALGRLLLPDSVVALDGDLGAGKTTFVRGLARGLGLEEGVSSPTYVLMAAHEGGRLPLYHFDAWMEGREKALFLDGGDHWLRAGGVAVVEWAERVTDHLPPGYLQIRLGHAGKDPGERLLDLACPAAGALGEVLRRALQASLEAHGAMLELLEGPEGPEKPALA